MRTRLFFLLLCMFFSATAQTLTPVTVALDWYINPDHAALLVAQKNGYFQQAGLKVTFIAPTETTEPEKLVATGEAQVAVTYQPYLLLDVAMGMPIVRFATLINHPLNCIAVLASSNIHSLSDLKGKTLGYSGGGLQSSVMKTILAHHHLTTQDLTLVNVKMNLVQALLSRRVDAVMGMMRNVEPIEMANMGAPTRLFFPEDNGVPSYDELLLVTNRANMKAPWLPRFVEALQKATAYIHAHPKASWRLVEKAYPTALAPSTAMAKTNAAIWQATLPYLDPHPGQLDSARYQRFEQFMQTTGLLKKPLSLSQYAIVP